MFRKGKFVLFFAAKWLEARVQSPGLRPQGLHSKLQKCQVSSSVEAVTYGPHSSTVTKKMLSSIESGPTSPLQSHSGQLQAC